MASSCRPNGLSSRFYPLGMRWPLESLWESQNSWPMDHRRIALVWKNLDRKVFHFPFSVFSFQSLVFGFFYFSFSVWPRFIFRSALKINAKVGERNWPGWVWIWMWMWRWTVVVVASETGKRDKWGVDVEEEPSLVVQLATHNTP